MIEEDSIKVTIKEIPYRIESCIVYLYDKKEIFISYYKELSNERKKELIRKAEIMFNENKKFYIEE